MEKERQIRIADLLDEVTAALPRGGEKRQGQSEMAQGVARAMARRRHLVVQAGTGTGKSLAYLVPALRAGRRVIVATATKALQDQLATKDLPFLASLRPPGSFSFAVLKGRSNYACRQRISETGLVDPAPGASVAQTLGQSVASSVGEIGAEIGAETLTPASLFPELEPPVAMAIAERRPSRADAGMTGGSSAEVGARGGPGGGAAGKLADQIRQLVEWAETSPTGDRSELDFEPDQRAWAAVSVGPRECPGAFRCPSGTVCFTEQAKARAAQADVVVVNTHLYATHVASGGVVLPDHDLVVLDEAHEVEDIMTSGLGVELTPGRIRALGQMARGLVDKDDTSAVEGLLEGADILEAVLRPLAGRRVLVSAGEVSASVGYRGGVGSRGRDSIGGRDAGGGGGRSGGGDAGGGGGGGGGRSRGGFASGGGFRSSDGPGGPHGPGEPHGPEGLSLELRPQSPDLTNPRPRLPQDEELVRILAILDGRMATVAQALRRSDRAQNDADPDASSKRSRALQSASHLVSDVRQLANAGVDEVVWVETSGPAGRFLALRLAPIDIGPLLAEHLWPNVTAVLTSATIPPLAEKRLGLPGGSTDRLDVESPFPYSEHAMLYCASHLPDRRSAGAETAIADELSALINAAGGRTLALFTSWRAMAGACERLRPELDFPIYAQGDLPKQKLLEAFSSDEAACLFATVSFWQGVDIPGRTLSLVTLDRLPFARPDDPLFQARRDKAGDRAFSLVDIPRAATLLAQGAGRLIRSSDDKGVVAVLDRRLSSSSYGRILRAALPPMRWTTERRAAVEFLQRISTEGETAPSGGAE